MKPVKTLFMTLECTPDEEDGTRACLTAVIENPHFERYFAYSFPQRLEALRRLARAIDLSITQALESAERRSRLELKDIEEPRL